MPKTLLKNPKWTKFDNLMMPKTLLRKPKWTKLSAK